MPRNHPKRKPPELVDIQDIRDTVVGIMKASGLTQKQIHERGGPTPGTQSKWNYEETKRPWLNTMRGALQACGYDFVIAPATQAVEAAPQHLRLVG